MVESFFKEVQDVHLELGQDLKVKNAFIFPSGISLQEDNRIQPIIYGLTDRIRRLIERYDENRNDIRIVYEGVAFRGRISRHLSSEGVWVALRKIDGTPPTLDALPGDYSAQAIDALMDPDLNEGGLILVMGSPGSGKTTTASATVVSRLRAFGGFAYTIEDPAEMMLHGRHGKGVCVQTEVEDNQWIEAMRGALRSQPAKTNLILFVGEVRDAESARIMLRAASNGFLTICTSFANDIPSGLQSLIDLVGEGYQKTLANILRVVIFNYKEQNTVRSQVLVSEGSSSKISANIRSGNFGILKDYIAQQQSEFEMKRMLGG